MSKLSVVFIFSLLAIACFAQNRATIDYKNIFSTSYTYVGIPKADSLYIFGTQQNKWQQLYRFKIPENTVAMDGNERRVFFLTKNEMTIQEYYLCAEYCHRDTLNLSEVNGKILPKHWIRNISSSEVDFAYFADSGLKYIYKDGDKWSNKSFSNPFEKTERKDPEFYHDMPYEKISVFDNDMYMVTQLEKNLQFWIFDPIDILDESPRLKKEITPTEKLNITLPKEVLSVFIYDNTELGWVYKDRIEFYRFEEEKQTWEKSKTPELKFNDILQ